MPNRNNESHSARKYPWTTIVIALLVIIVAAVSGVIAGNAIIRNRTAAAESARIDEYLGLGERTGLTGDVDLQVSPMSLSVQSGKLANVKLTLVNRTSRSLKMNGWLSPAPESFRNNQLPFKVKITRNGRPVRYAGNAILFPPHTKKDFFALRPGQSKQITMDVSRGAADGKWEMSAPGNYTAEIWYETYLTGKQIGVKAWTGMTNHVVVRVTVK